LVGVVPVDIRTIISLPCGNVQKYMVMGM
jgi:hypothetical protein